MEQEILEEEAAVEGDFYEVDETLSPLEALLKYARSDFPPQRHAYLRGLGVVAAQVASGSSSDVQQEQLHSLASLAQEALTSASNEEDMDGILQVLEQLPCLGAALEPVLGQEPLLSLAQACLSVVAHHIGDSDVQSSGAAAYAALLTHMPLSTATQRITLDIQHLLDTGLEDQVCLAVLLLGQWAMSLATPAPASSEPSHWQALCTQLLEVLKAPDSADAVKEALLQHGPAISLLLPTHQRGPQLLVPLCTTLASDPTWTVRAAVAKALPAATVALTLPPDTALPTAQPTLTASSSESVNTACATRESSATQTAPESSLSLVNVLCRQLAKDVSQWVRQAAIQAAGPTLVALARVGFEGPAVLLETYCQCVGGVRTLPAEVLQEAAQCLVEISRTAHSSSSSSQLITVWQGLLQSGDRQTVCAVCSQLPRLASVLGADVVTQQLLPHLYNLQPQEMQEHVRQAVLPWAAALVELLPAADTGHLLDFVLQPSACSAPAQGLQVCGAWRHRLALAQQLARLAASAQKACSTVHEGVVSCAVELCRDPVWAVRQEAARQLGVMLHVAVANQFPSVGALLDSVFHLMAPAHPAIHSSPTNTSGSAAGVPTACLRLFSEACYGFLHPSYEVLGRGSSSGAMTELFEAGGETGQTGQLQDLLTQLHRFLRGEHVQGDTADLVDQMVQALRVCCGEVSSSANM